MIIIDVNISLIRRPHFLLCEVNRAGCRLNFTSVLPKVRHIEMTSLIAEVRGGVVTMFAHHLMIRHFSQQTFCHCTAGKAQV